MRVLLKVNPFLLLSMLFCVQSVFTQIVWADWQAHQIRQGDGRGGWIQHPAQIQVLKHPNSVYTMPFGLVRMANGELAINCSWERAGSMLPVMAFSKDDGATWSDFQTAEGTTGRPMNLTAHGGGKLSFLTTRRYFSSDYGRTWPTSVEHPKTDKGMLFDIEGKCRSDS